MIPLHVHISTGISKLGPTIPSVSLPAVVTCRPDAPCKDKCYARRGRFVYPKVRACLQRNLTLWQKAPEQYAHDILIAAYPCRFFRWHSSGDIPDAAYLDMMARVAAELPDTCFLAFTKQHEVVNAYLREGKPLPPNLSIVLSAWGDWIPENPFNLPIAYIRFRHTENPVPTDAMPCSRYCGECVLGDSHCWNLQPGQSVFFDEH